MARPAFSKKSPFTSKLELNLRKKLVKCCILYSGKCCDICLPYKT
jgi:hypothetical protein